jgi:uncharacterized membrane protein
MSLLKSVEAYFRNHRQMMVVGALGLSSALSVGLFAARVVRTQSVIHIFLIWNLFLAWLPMWCALGAYNLYKRESRRGWLLVLGCALMWLLFMPNAPYLVTDIVNLSYQRNMLFWYDVVMFAAFAWTGVFLGLVSLFLMQEIVRKTTGRLVSWLFAFGVLGLSSFGIYLGRFLRWNSWDVFSNPVSLLTDIAAAMRHPIANPQAYIFSMVFTVFIVSTYLMLMALMNFRQETAEG